MAIRFDLESCVVSREGDGEALTGARAGSSKGLTFSVALAFAFSCPSSTATPRGGRQENQLSP
jgi:hypothetical protein